MRIFYFLLDLALGHNMHIFLQLFAAHFVFEIMQLFGRFCLFLYAMNPCFPPPPPVQAPPCLSTATMFAEGEISGVTANASLKLSTGPGLTATFAKFSDHGFDGQKLGKV